MILSGSILCGSAIPCTFTDSFKGVTAVCAYVCVAVYLHLKSQAVLMSNFYVQKDHG